MERAIKFLFFYKLPQKMHSTHQVFDGERHDDAVILVVVFDIDQLDDVRVAFNGVHDLCL